MAEPSSAIRRFRHRRLRQFEVLKTRPAAEFALLVEFDACEFQPGALDFLRRRQKRDAIVAGNGSGIADDLDGDVVSMARSAVYLDYKRECAEGFVFIDVKDVNKAG